MEDIKQYLAMLGATGERGDPLVFSGRERIINDVLVIAQLSPVEGNRSNTVLIQGAPGAGKTALISKLARRLKDEGTGAVVCNSVPAYEDDIRDVYVDMAVALGVAPPETARTTTASRSETSGGFGALFRGLLSRSKSVAPPNIRSAAAVARLGGGRELKSDKRAVVFVDEVQNLRQDSPAANMLDDLHTQSSIPVLLVCSGLSNSERVLKLAGLSRINAANIIPLGRLAPEETLDGARRTLEKVRDAGLPASDGAIGRWAEQIAGACDDWPRHLQCYLTACWKTLANQGAPNLDSADLEAAMALGDGLRSAYYVKRVSASETDIRILGALHRRLQTGERISPTDAYRLIGEAAARLDPENRKMHEERFPRGGACFEQVLKSGVVSLDEQGYCVSPVPSLSDHILAKYAEDAGDSSRRTGRASPLA